tara:strand:+ start:330 stop:629 length:300 start_codon:yes stop_codon:yes gene_type:complete
MDIPEVNTIPDYINNFITSHNHYLKEINTKGNEENNGEGCLVLKFHNTENKVDVMFYTDSLIDTVISREAWNNILKKKDNKDIYLVIDKDINNIFVLYI